MDLAKNNSFLTEEAINYLARTEKRKKVPACEMLESSAFSSLMEIISHLALVFLC